MWLAFEDLEREKVPTGDARKGERKERGRALFLFYMTFGVCASALTEVDGV